MCAAERRYGRKVMFIWYEDKANRAKGWILSVEFFGLKLFAKFKYDINEIWRNRVGTYKLAHFAATIFHTISSDISSNKTDTNNFIFSGNITQKCVADDARYVETSIIKQAR
jgi:hypothetical protein